MAYDKTTLKLLSTLGWGTHVDCNNLVGSYEGNADSVKEDPSEASLD